MFNARKIGERFIFEGTQVAIDGDEVTYESLCPSCYFRECEAVGADPFS
jgi:thymidine kinase